MKPISVWIQREGHESIDQEGLTADQVAELTSERWERQ